MIDKESFDSLTATATQAADQVTKQTQGVTDRDIAIRGVAEGKGPDAKVRDAMSPEVKYCFEDEDVAHVAENMAELQVRRLPVMNRDKLLVGIVSLGDLAIDGSLPKTAKALHGISQPGGQHNQSRS